MREITPTMISQFLPSLQEEGLAHGTAEKIYVIIRLIFKMAFLGDLIERNPMGKVPHLNFSLRNIAKRFRINEDLEPIVADRQIRAADLILTNAPYGVFIVKKFSYLIATFHSLSKQSTGAQPVQTDACCILF